MNLLHRFITTIRITHTLRFILLMNNAFLFNHPNVIIQLAHRRRRRPNIDDDNLSPKTYVIVCTVGIYAKFLRFWSIGAQKRDDDDDQKYEPHSITSLKFNANLVRKKRFNAKKFAPIELQNNDWNNDEMEEDAASAFAIDPNAAAMPLIIDKSEEEKKTKHRKLHHHHSDISMLSEVVLQEEEEEDDDDIVIVLDEDVGSRSNKEHITSTHSTSASNVSELFESNSIDGGNSFAALFDDTDDDGHCSPSLDRKYTDCIELNLPHIMIPQSDKELIKKAKPAYKWHLEMIDDDGSILREIEERKKRRAQQKKQKKKIEQQQDEHEQFERKRYHKKTAECMRVCYFEEKPLGFQINESPESIFVTNVYEDRGSAYLKGIQKGWKIVAVNEESGIREMMNELRNSNGPFEITFDTNGDC